MPPAKATTATCGLGWSAPMEPVSDDDCDLDYNDWEHFMDAPVANGLVNSKKLTRSRAASTAGRKRRHQGGGRRHPHEDTCAVQLCVIS
mmetsp:Transcript_22537/g.42348  ORF Transcript_22537/g.42348 Transcript_22537/m.42348 type:complete len:89 (+) Transcript_22537:19-285(+)